MLKFWLPNKKTIISQFNETLSFSAANLEELPLFKFPKFHFRTCI